MINTESNKGRIGMNVSTKVYRVVVALTFFLLILSKNTLAEEGIPLFYLNGDWISHDYDCPSGVPRTEKITISIEGNDIRALKTDSGGDNCVPTGSDSFNGSLPSELPVERSFPIVMVLGTPSSPACCTGRAYLVMVDVDNFNVCLEPGCSRQGWVVHFSRINFVPQL
ncbi:MAG: hypothetical protein JKY19_13090 [Alcanivoracaceae bacterium]|nr:hypothetical protein [Alcanivoracaceae bacterium]